MFEWKAEYETGISEIDAQHRRVFAMAAELHAAILEGCDQATLGALLAGLASFSREHFEAEESLMRAVNYAGLAEHHAAHNQLSSAIGAVSRITPDAAGLLNGWLTHHITEVDRKMSAALRLRP